MARRRDESKLRPIPSRFGRDSTSKLHRASGSRAQARDGRKKTREDETVRIESSQEEGVRGQGVVRDEGQA